MEPALGIFCSDDRPAAGLARSASLTMRISCTVTFLLPAITPYLQEIPVGNLLCQSCCFRHFVGKCAGYVSAFVAVFATTFFIDIGSTILGSPSAHEGRLLTEIRYTEVKSWLHPPEGDCRCLSRNGLTAQDLQLDSGLPTLPLHDQ